MRDRKHTVFRGKASLLLVCKLTGSRGLEEPRTLYKHGHQQQSTERRQARERDAAFSQPSNIATTYQAFGRLKPEWKSEGQCYGMIAARRWRMKCACVRVCACMLADVL